MRCGESVRALVALWCAGKRLLFSFPCLVIAGRHLVHWLKWKDCPHCVARLHGTFTELDQSMLVHNPENFGGQFRGVNSHVAFRSFAERPNCANFQRHRSFSSLANSTLATLHLVDFGQFDFHPEFD